MQDVNKKNIEDKRTVKCVLTVDRIKHLSYFICKLYLKDTFLTWGSFSLCNIPANKEGMIELEDNNL